MSVQSGPTFKRYAANGVTTVYAIPFLLLDAADLLVTLDGVEVISGFVLTGVGNPSSTCTFSAAPTGDLLFQLSIPFQRLADYQENGDLLSGTLNNDLDRLWLAIKQLSGGNDRALSTGVLEPEGIPALPVAADRSLHALAFDALGNPVASTLTISEIEQQPALAASAAASASASAAAADASKTAAAGSASAAAASAGNAAASEANAAMILANSVQKTGAQTMDGPLAVTGGITSIPFNKEYVSAEQVITSGGPLTLTHGLGVKPKLVTAELVCKTAQLGYAVGDVVLVAVGQQSTNLVDGSGLSIIPTSTEIKVRYGNEVAVFIINVANTGAGSGITNANWRLVVRAWA